MKDARRRPLQACRTGGSRRIVGGRSEGTSAGNEHRKGVQHG